MGSELISLMVIAIIGLIYGGIKKGIHNYIADFLKHFLNKFFHDPFDGKKINDEYLEIRDKLIELRIKLDADRVHVSQFSNGNSFTNTKPIWKLSRTYEICDNGITYESPNFQNIMAITVWPILSALFSDNEIAKRVTNKYCEEHGNKCERPLGVYQYIVEDIHDSNVKFSLKEQGIKWFLQAPLLDINKNVIGVMNIEFMDLSDKEINYCEICEMAQEISYIINKK